MDRGLTGKAASDYATLENTNFTQFKFSRESLPASFRKPGYGEVFQQLRRYVIGQTEFLGTIIARDLKDWKTMGAKALGQGGPGLAEMVQSGNLGTRFGKWLGAHMAVFGPRAALPFGAGAALEEYLRKKGSPELLSSGLFMASGLYIGNQIGLGFLPAESLRDLWFFLPGAWGNTIADAASVGTYLAAKAGAGGVRFEYGMDLTPGPGMGNPMTPAQLASKLTRLLPVAGISANRVRQAIMDLQSSGALRQPETLGQAYTGVHAGGVMREPKAGDPLSIGTDFAKTILGIQPPERARRFETATEEQQMLADHATVTRRAAQLRTMGSQEAALALESTFFQQYGLWPSRTREGLLAARKRAILTPEQRRIREAPRALRPELQRRRTDDGEGTPK